MQIMRKEKRVGMWKSTERKTFSPGSSFVCLFACWGGVGMYLGRQLLSLEATEQEWGKSENQRDRSCSLETILWKSPRNQALRTESKGDADHRSQKARPAVGWDSRVTRGQRVTGEALVFLGGTVAAWSHHGKGNINSNKSLSPLWRQTEQQSSPDSQFCRQELFYWFFSIQT